MKKAARKPLGYFAVNAYIPAMWIRGYQILIMFMIGSFLITLETKNGLIIGFFSIGGAYIATWIPMKIHDIVYSLTTARRRRRRNAAPD